MNLIRNGARPKITEFNVSKHADLIEQIRTLDNALGDVLEKHRPTKTISSTEVRQTSDEYAKAILEKGARVFLIILDKTLIGFIGTIPSEYESTLWITSFIIDEQYRGKGYGTSAFQYFEKFISMEYKHTGITAHSENSAAVALYKKLGFKTYSLNMFR